MESVVFQSVRIAVHVSEPKPTNDGTGRTTTGKTTNGTKT